MGRMLRLVIVLLSMSLASDNLVHAEDAISVDLIAGYNLISIPKADEAYTAESLLQKINNEGGVATKIYKFAPQGWSKHDLGSETNNFAIELGVGYFIYTTSNSTVELVGATVDGAIQMVGGDSHSLAVLSNGTVLGWGDNWASQLGDSTTTNQLMPVMVQQLGGGRSLTNVIKVATGGAHGLALLSDSTVAGWGLNEDGQLGDGNSGDNLFETAPVTAQRNGSALSDVTDIAVGSRWSFALLSDSTVIAWGWNFNGNLGGGTDIIGSVTPLEVLNVAGSGPLTDVEQIVSGGGHSLALLSDGTVVAWGNGPLGNGIDLESNLPVVVQAVGGGGALSNVVQLSVGNAFSLALLSDGTVVAWGNGFNGKLGDGTQNERLTPIVVQQIGGGGPLSNVVQIASEGDFNLALLSDSTVVSWGSNEFGQLGDGTNIDRYTPVVVQQVGGGGALTGVVEIGAGGGHSLAILSDGSMLTWGLNHKGQLGDGTTVEQNLPVVVK